MMDRRSFVKSTLLAAASVGAAPMLARAQNPTPANLKVRGANEDIRVAVVGFRSRGGDHIGGFREVPGVRLVALCDVDKRVLDKGVKNCTDKGEKVVGYTDIRKLLENPDIDAVSFGTPNHWHALGTIWAVQAGKDVYVEKPISHNVWEGRKMVEAARKYNRMVQGGTQSRSSSGIAETIEWLRAGNHGKILRARGTCYKPRGSIGKTSGAQEVPKEIDYDLWCGPAPLTQPHRNNPKFGSIHYDWHWFWAYGAGDLGNQGVHQMDIARWVLGEKELAPEVFSVGGRLGYEDDAETPNTMIMYHGYKAAPLIFEVRGLPSKSGTDKMDNIRGSGVGVLIECEGGDVLIPNYRQAIVRDKKGTTIKEFKGEQSHYGNFIKAVRSRKHTDLTADVEEGHVSAALCHLSNISYRLGDKKSPEKIHDAVKNNSDMAEALGRMEEHLGRNNVDLKKTPATLGEVLKFDPKTEKFIGNRKANELLTREYRKPFVVPEKV